MSENTELPSGGSAKANGAGLASVAVIGAALTYFVNFMDPSTAESKEFMVAVRHAIPAMSLGIYLGIAWFLAAWGPERGEVIKARKAINESIKECDAILASEDSPSDFKAEIQLEKQKLQKALIDSRAVNLN